MLELDSEQRKAVEHGEGPLLIIAGPGSGKTRVITQRIVYLLKTVPGLQPANILAVTFTEKAAENMKALVREELGAQTTSPHISTFHSFCYEVLRKRHFERVLLDKVDVWIFLRRRMDQLGLKYYQKLSEPGAFLHALNDFFARCQDELIDPADFEKFVQALENDFSWRASGLDPAGRKLEAEEIEKQKELARVFRKSRELVESAGCSGLGSLISETVHLWDREPEVLAEYQRRFPYVLVDEFQDTNFAQVELLQRLAAPPHNIAAVGDDDQAIYRFRGASYGAFKMFDKAFPGHQTVFLDRNYRSTKKILRLAEVVISKNERYEKKKKLRTEKQEGAPVYLIHPPDYASEASWIAGEIGRLASLGTRFGEIAVLYRAHNYRDLLVEEFRRRKIPLVVRGLSVLQTVILRDLLAYLKLIYSHHDNISLTRVLLMPRWKFPETLAREMRRQAARDRCSLYDVLESWRMASEKSPLDQTSWPELKTILSELKGFAEHGSMTALLDRLIDRLEIRFLPGDADREYVEAFGKFLANWEAKSESPKLGEFMEYFPYFLEAGGKIETPEPEQYANAVQLMTVHAAKGLEFPLVFVLSVSPRRFPAIDRKPVIEFPDVLRKAPLPPSDIHTQEERRLFYVALTRAKERLYVSSVAAQGKKTSVFVDDLTSDATTRARDLEDIQAPAVSPETKPRPVPERPAQPEAQAGLFGGISNRGAVHPALAEWAASPPSLPLDGKLRLSATAIEDYMSCPLKFKFGHFLKIPTGPQGALTFGNILHSCVRRYFELRKKALPEFLELEKFYLDSWKSAGFEDSYQEESYKKAGLEQIRVFVGRQNATPVDADKIHAEEHFKLGLGDVVLEGRIDQIKPLEARSGKSVELVDYKTGRPRSQKDADKSLQLSVYALAARDQFGLEPRRLTFYNLTNNEAVSSVRTENEIKEVRRQIFEVAEEIRKMIFPPTPGFVCKYCDYVAICPAHENEL